MMRHLLVLLSLVWALPALPAGTVSVSTTDLLSLCTAGLCKTGKKITVTAVADASAATYPTKELEMRGFVIKVITNPGSTAPTDDYDIACQSAEDSSLDVFASALNNRDTANTEQVYPVFSGATAPIYVNDRCTLAISNNSVNSASTVITFYVLNP